MKTSIIISSVAVLCLMITIAETPSDRTDVKVKSFPVNPINYLTLNNSVSTNLNKSNSPRINFSKTFNTENMTRILNYLKFDVSDYKSEEMITEEPDETTFDYLKFNADDYTTVTEALPSDETNFINKDLSYLKFDVRNYLTSSDDQISETTETTETGLSYLKFDANKYYSSNSEKVTINELPAVELN